MLVKMKKGDREIDVNASPDSIAALEKFGWELVKPKPKAKKKAVKKEAE